jgi:hypothetical protein
MLRDTLRDLFGDATLDSIFVGPTYVPVLVAEAGQDVR